jgi:hypothetical protein
VKRRTRQNPLATARDLGDLSIIGSSPGKGRVGIGSHLGPEFDWPGNLYSAIVDRPEVDLNADYGIAPDDDITTLLQDALDELPDGTPMRIRGGHYGIDAMCQSTGKSIFLDAPGVVLHQTSSGNLMRLDGQWDVAIAVESYDATVRVTAGSTSNRPATVFTFASPPPWQKGDLFKVFSDDPIPYGRPSDTSEITRTGKFFTVWAISGDEVTVLERPTDPLLTNVRAARMHKHTAVVRGPRFVSDNPDSFVGGMLTGRSLYRPQFDASFGALGMIACKTWSCFAPEANIVVDGSMNDSTSGKLGYGMSESSSEYGRFYIRAGFVRHAYTDDTDYVEAGDPNPYSYGRPYGHHISGIAYGTQDTAWSPHATARSHRFDVQAHHCHQAMSLRGIEHTGTLYADYCGDVLNMADEDWYGQSGASFGHDLESVVARHIQTTGSTNPAISVGANTDAGSPELGQRETRKNVIRSLSLFDVNKARAVRLINHTLEIGECTIVADPTLPNNAQVFYTDNADLTIGRGDVDFRANAAGTGLVLFGDNNVGSLVRTRELRWRFGSGAVARISAIATVLSGATKLDVQGLEVDYAVSATAGGFPAAGSTLDYKVLDTASKAVRGYFAATNANVAGTGMPSAIGMSAQPVVIMDVRAQDANRTVAKFEPGAFRGQILIVTAPTSTGGYTVTIPHDSTNNLTYNIGGVSVVLSNRQSAAWFWTGSVWHQLVI